MLKKAERFCIWNDSGVGSPAPLQSHSPSQGSAHPWQSPRDPTPPSLLLKQPPTSLFCVSQPRAHGRRVLMQRPHHTAQEDSPSSASPLAGFGTSSLSCGCSPRALRTVCYYSWHLCLNTSGSWAQQCICNNSNAWISLKPIKGQELGRMAREGVVGRTGRGLDRKEAVLVNVRAQGRSIMEEYPSGEQHKRNTDKDMGHSCRDCTHCSKLTWNRSGSEKHRKPWLCIFEISHYSGFPAPNLSEFCSMKNLCINPPPPWLCNIA